MPEELNDRAADVWEPLFVLAEIAGGAWPDKARAASIGLTDGPQEKAPGTVLIREILNCFEAAKTDRLFSWSLVVWLKQVENAPWAGRKISERWLARQLKPYGVRPRTIWFMEVSAKGYMREDFGEVFRRYLPPSG